MKIKIKEVLRKDDTFKTKKGATGYPYAVKLEGSEEVVKVVTYSDKLEVKNGAVFESGVNCRDISKDENEHNGNKYWQYTIFALKKENTFQKGNTFKKISIQDYEYAIEWCKEKAFEVFEFEKEGLEYFKTLLDNMLDHVEFEATPKVDIGFDGDNPFSDDDTPF